MFKRLIQLLIAVAAVLALLIGSLLSWAISLQSEKVVNETFSLMRDPFRQQMQIQTVVLDNGGTGAGWVFAFLLLCALVGAAVYIKVREADTKHNRSKRALMRGNSQRSQQAPTLSYVPVYRDEAAEGETLEEVPPQPRISRVSEVRALEDGGGWYD